MWGRKPKAGIVEKIFMHREDQSVNGHLSCAQAGLEVPLGNGKVQAPVELDERIREVRIVVVIIWHQVTLQIGYVIFVLGARPSGALSVAPFVRSGPETPETRNYLVSFDICAPVE